MLRCCLHHRTLIFLPFLAFFFPHYFDADNELIAAVGLLRTPETLDDEIHCFYDHPANRRFLRRKLHLRISVRRVRREFFALIERTAVKST